ncbi:MAG: prolyl oligopeptidase family serine peptidase [Nitrososphaerales archaeon]
MPKDAYAWLEKVDDPRVVEWARMQDRVARRSLKRESDKLFKRLVPYYRLPLMRFVQLTEAGIVLFYSDDKSYKVELVVKDGSRESITDSVRLGKATVIQAVQARKDGRVIAIHHSQGGSDEGTVSMLDRSTGEVVDSLSGFIGDILWVGDGSNYYYVRSYRNEKTPDGIGPPAARIFFREGRQETMAFGRGLPTNTFIGMAESREGSKVILNAFHGFSRSRPYGGPVRRPELWAPVYRETDSVVTGIDYADGRYFLLSFERSCGEVLTIGRRGARRVVIRESEWPIQDVALVGDRLLCHYLVDACSELRFYDRGGKLESSEKFDVPGSLVGEPAIAALGNEAVFAFSSFTLPYRVYRVRGSRLETVLTQEVRGKYAVRHGHATSADGTKIHYFLASKKDTSLRKALLFGYGGFRVSLAPSFNPAYLPLLEDGAAYAVANLRGGLEQGEAWHRAGMREKKFNVFDDYLAVLAKLRREKMDVVGFGRSNGGLLMGATMNKRPDLFSGVLIGYPVLDMMAFHRLLMGRAWVPEYGDPDDPSDAKFLLRYSPYHNVRQGTHYPPVLIYTGLKDDRVHPAHAFKFYSRLKEVGADVMLRVEVESGHIGTTPRARIREEADKLAFVYRALDMSPA